MRVASFICGGQSMRVFRWGSSLAVRLPADLVEALALKDGDEIGMRAAGTRSLEVWPKPSKPALQSYRGRLPADFRFDRSGTNERGCR